MPTFNFGGKAYTLQNGVFVPQFPDPEKESPWAVTTTDSTFGWGTTAAKAASAGVKKLNDYLSLLSSTFGLGKTFYSGCPFLGHSHMKPPHYHAPTATEVKMRAARPERKAKGNSSLDRLRREFWDIGKFRWKDD